MAPLLRAFFRSGSAFDGLQQVIDRHPPTIVVKPIILFGPTIEHIPLPFLSISHLHEIESFKGTDGASIALSRKSDSGFQQSSFTGN